MTKLKKAREKHYISQAALAKLTKVPLQTVISHDIGRRNPKYETLVKYAKALGCDPGDLIG